MTALCPSCGLPLEPEPLPSGRPLPPGTDQRVGRTVRALMAELLGRANTPEMRRDAIRQLAERFGAHGHAPADARRMAEAAVGFLLGDAP